jgi:hypothetical protein
MQLIEVTNTNQAKEFLLVNRLINKDDPNYIQPLNKDVEEVFDPTHNKQYQKGGETIRWLLKNDAGQLIGRIAAFYNDGYIKTERSKVGGCGFFDCINDQTAANTLFDAAKNWLVGKGMIGMDGPINFGERDRWWGCLVDGFFEPLYCMNYNQPYYGKLFENYGFGLYYNMFCFTLKADKKLDEKFYGRHAKFASKKEYRVERINKSNLQKSASDFCTVYNAAWAGHGGGKEMTDEQAQKLFQSMKFIIDDKIAFITYYNEDPIAIWMNIPDLNQVFKFFKGKFGLWEKIQFYWRFKIRKESKKFVGLVFGVIPKYQALGIDSYMVVEGAKTIQGQTHYKDLELQWQADWNPKMLNVSKHLGCELSRTLICFRYNFDRTIPFERHEMLT